MELFTEPPKGLTNKLNTKKQVWLVHKEGNQYVLNNNVLPSYMSIASSLMTHKPTLPACPLNIFEMMMGRLCSDPPFTLSPRPPTGSRGTNTRRS